MSKKEVPNLTGLASGLIYGERLTMYKGLMLLFLLFFVLTLTLGQEPKRAHVRFEMGMVHYEKGHFADALPYFVESSNLDSSYIPAYLFRGLCLLNSSDKPLDALGCFELGLQRALRFKEDPDLHFDLLAAKGEALLVLHRLDEALVVYREMKQLFLDSLYQQSVDTYLERAAAIRHSLYNSVDAQVKPLPKPLNSQHDDHLGCYSPDGGRLYFTSKRESEKDSLGFYEQMYVSERSDSGWRQPALFPVFDQERGHESVLSISPDGRIMFVFRGKSGAQQIFRVELDEQSHPHPSLLPEPIHGPYRQTHASLSPDKSTLFFTSDRPGGIGGLDIYMSKLDTTGRWGNPRNLGSNINTPHDEETPFLHANGHTLYFSSDGHPGLGQMDVYFAEMFPDSSFSKACNMGYPINDVEDDFGLWPDIANQKALLSSSRQFGKVGGSDLFEIMFPASAGSNVAVVQAEISDTLYPVQQVLVHRQNDGILIGDYRPEPKESVYDVFLETGYEYRLEEKTAQGQSAQVALFVPDSLAYGRIGHHVSLQIVKDALVVHRNQKEKEVMWLSEEVKPMDTRHDADAAYVIQVLALRRKPLYAFAYLRFLDLATIEVLRCSDGYMRYVYGNYPNIKAAKVALKQIQHNGRYPDAFIRRYGPLKKLKQ